MSYVIVRRHTKTGEFQRYKDVGNIFGAGEWEGDDGKWWHFPMTYPSYSEAVVKMGDLMYAEVINNPVSDDPWDWWYAVWEYNR